MKRLYFNDLTAWREWLAANHAAEPKGIWLVFDKHAAGRDCLTYEQAVQEALCFGWIDSVIRRIDADQYCRKFTPRKDRSQWSCLNKQRVAKVIREGRMTEFGLAKIKAAKRLGNWSRDPRPQTSLEVPRELAAALEHDPKSREFFDSLAPTYRKHFILWISTAKQPETRAKRIKEASALLAAGKRLGLK